MRHAIVTGATTGIGLSIAKKLLEQNCEVHGVSKTQDNWEEARKYINDERYLLEQCDLTQESQVKEYISGVHERTGKLDIVINNAGYVDTLTRVEDTSIEEMNLNFSHNLFTSFLVCKYTIPILREQDNSIIVNVSSMAGTRAVPMLSAYSISKFGVVALSQSIAKENKDVGLKCISICPAGVNTRMRVKLFGEIDADKQQSADYIASVVAKIIDKEIQIESGGAMMLKNSEITGILMPPDK